MQTMPQGMRCRPREHRGLLRNEKRRAGGARGSPPVGGTVYKRHGQRPRERHRVLFRLCDEVHFCQNHDISAGGYGRDISTGRLAEIFLELQEKGAWNINLVSPTPFVPEIIRALDMVKGRLDIPVVYNTGGYERVETLRALEGCVDIYLPDVKYFSDALAVELSSAPRYFETAMAAVEEMLRQTGRPQYSPDGMLQKGVIVRHLVIPGHYHDSEEVIRRVGERFGQDVLFSLMSQYTPFWKAREIKSLNRRLTTFEYRKALDAVYDAGLEGFMQERSSAKEEYTPDFDLTGI